MVPRSCIFCAQVLGTAKNAIVVWIGIVFLSEKVTWLQGAHVCTHLSVRGVCRRAFPAVLKLPSLVASGACRVHWAGRKRDVMVSV